MNEREKRKKKINVNRQITPKKRKHPKKERKKERESATTEAHRRSSNALISMKKSQGNISIHQHSSHENMNSNKINKLAN